MKFQPLVCLAVASFLCMATLPHNVHAAASDTQKLIDADVEAAKKKAALDQINTDEITQKIQDTANDARVSKVKLAVEKKYDDEADSQSDELAEAINAVPSSLAQTEILVRDLLKTRFRELDRIPVVAPSLASQSGANSLFKVEYLIDSSWVTPVETQYADLFKRYFCDPEASNGRDAVSAWSMKNVLYQNSKADYTLSCGKVSGSSISTRESMLGAGNEKTDEGRKIIGLPLRPAELFFNPITLPVQAGVSGNSKETNVSKMADVYFGAYATSLYFLIGSAGPVDNSLTTQAEVSRKMLATYPFALMFAERAGTMNNNAAKALADVLQEKLAGGQSDKLIQAKIADLRNRNTLSLAEYMDIVMFQVPTSPGYNASIGELTHVQLLREEVWLNAMQTALNYQRNRWLEIQAALEAVK